MHHEVNEQRDAFSPAGISEWLCTLDQLNEIDSFKLGNPHVVGCTKTTVVKDLE